MSIVIYTGLSLPYKDANKILEAEYLPPVKRGDIHQLISKRSDIDIIGIIDGEFHQSPAVSHKEILEALNKGITVIGGSSMGALRACELYPYGMIGVGKIFEDYKEGLIDSDDDVAVSLNPETLEAMSDSYINIKYNLKMAVDDKIITNEEMLELLDIAKQTYYPKRTFSYIIKKSNLNSNKQSILLEYIREKDYDIKREDAIEVIEYIKQLGKDNNEYNR
ncbi:MAG: TfuA-related McrA-glycine thioamidation protein [Methanosphaera sp.]|nr:TfuA-related McrA-glycine thioamidation protein [Methanosphaera sp.]